MQSSDTKFRTVFHALCDAIDAGKFVPEERMPSEKALAEQFHVSLPTIRRAGQDLVAMGMLEKRGGDGTYVVPDNDVSGQRCVHFLYVRSRINIHIDVFIGRVFFLNAIIFHSTDDFGHRFTNSGFDNFFHVVFSDRFID